MVKVLKKCLSVVQWILIIILSFYLIFTVSQKIFSKNNSLLIGNYYIFEIKSGSMEYGLHIGDLIVVKKTDELKINDVITYKKDNSLITHRIKKINGNEIITQGDANNTEDEPITRDDVIGKFLFKSYLLSYLKKYKIIVLGIIVAWLVIDYTFSKEDEKNKIKESETNINEENN